MDGKEDADADADAYADASTTDAPSFLQLLVDQRNPECNVKSRISPSSQSSTDTDTNAYAYTYTYLAVARAALGTLATKVKQLPKAQNSLGNGNVIILGHHSHDCKLRDFEEVGGHHLRIVVTLSLRHPLARISSGISRRMKFADNTRRDHNALLVEHFVSKDHGTSSAEAFLAALRNESDPLHTIALNATVGPKRQSHMLPITEFYLAGSLHTAEVDFLCIDTLDEDFARVFHRWFGYVDLAYERVHVSTVSSGVSTVTSRFSPESVEWVERTYAKDIALYQYHCPEGYRNFYGDTPYQGNREWSGVSTYFLGS